MQMRGYRFETVLTCAMLLFVVFPVFSQEWPPANHESKPGSRWWWLGSAVDEKNLEWNIKQYASHGIGTLEITPLYGVQGNDQNNIPFLSERWMEILRFCQDEGKNNGIRIDMNCGTGWPFGGPEVKMEEAACKLVLVDTTVTHEQLTDLVIAISPKEKPYSVLQKVMAFSVNVPKYTNKNVTKVADVTNAVTDGHLRLRNVDKGIWRIIAIFAGRTRQKVKRAAPGGEGWVVDHFDSTAVAHYLQRFEIVMRFIMLIGLPVCCKSLRSAEVISWNIDLDNLLMVTQLLFMITGKHWGNCCWRISSISGCVGAISMAHWSATKLMARRPI